MRKIKSKLIKMYVALVFWFIGWRCWTLSECMTILTFLDFIDPVGNPKRCIKCGHKKFKIGQEWVGPCGVEEYTVVCSKCEKINGHWAYGNWSAM